MNWAQLATIWKQLKGKIALHRAGIADDRKILLRKTLKGVMTKGRRFALTTAKGGMSSHNTSVVK